MSENECKVQTWKDAWRHEMKSTREKRNKINMPRLTSRKIITSEKGEGERVSECKSMSQA
jgi:hypothetical protein